MRYAIVGAGLAGLTAAWELSRLDKDAQIEVFEATDRIGGKLFSVPFDGGPVDLGAEAFLVRRPAARELLDELGLSDHVVGTTGRHSTVYTAGEMKDLPGRTVMGIPATSEPVAHLVSAETAARIDAESDAEPVDWAPGEDRNVGRLVRERFGDDLADRVVSALLGGVYSCTADDLGLRATVPQLAAALDDLSAAGQKVTLTGGVKAVFEQRQRQAAEAKAASWRGQQEAAGEGEQPKKPAPIFGALSGGMRELYEALAEQSGAQIYLDAFVSGVLYAAPRRAAGNPERNTGEFQLVGAGDGTYDRVILATPAPTTARLLRDVCPEAYQTLGTVKLASSVVVGLHVDSDEGLPDNSGVLVAADEPGVRAKAFTFSSKKWAHLAERGGLTLRASFGRFGGDALVRAEEDDLVDWALDDLQTITGFDARAAGVSEIFVQRWYGGIPRYDEHHLGTVAAVRAQVARVPGLDVAGAWAGGVGVPAVIADARACAARMTGGGAA
ncbi:protoporphyrinogen oxidase [Corynebacterium atypicum]|uniref:Coproporphyrinogen III oxidase n=1 Tax=Corynebacterium atypicum TaxID=191610 RepID=A0ABM5QLE8_9CORY|nr:protoporphyrinogen oxidase [Corynebacterium atypicum]AIG63600.1 protoporphyrinogen oxidase [Corynebacterium atypicum]